MNKHHVKPRSRVKRKDKNTNNIVGWDLRFHDYWHRCFSNLTVLEIIEFIITISTPGTRWTQQDLQKLKRKIKGE